jgi:PEGA domain-containing protein
VRPYKRFLMLAALVAVAIVGSAASSEAQYRGRGRVVVVGGGFYSPYYYPFFYADPWYGFQYPYPPHPYGYGYRFGEPEASVRLDVKPKQAEVYVDGYYAGIVDDFDGTFQRLHMSPGEHEIELWLDGYRTVRQRVHLSPDNTFRVKYQMEQLAAGQAQEPKPEPIAPPDAGNQPRMQPRGGQPMGRGPMTRPLPPAPDPRDAESPRGPEPPRGRQANGSNGTLAIRVQPGDAEVSIDGEAWRGPGGQERLTVEVPEGSHTVEIRKAGFRTYVTQVDVRRGQTTPLNVSLRGDQ